MKSKEKGTLSELIQAYSYQEGIKKINRTPKGIKDLIINLTNTVNNSAVNGYASNISVKYKK